MPIDLAYVAALAPECVLVIAAVIAFVGGTWLRSRLFWMAFALIAIGLATLLWMRGNSGISVTPAPTADGARVIAQGPLLMDSLSHTLRGAALVAGALFALFATQSRQFHVLPEIMGGLLLVIAGLMLVCGAGDLVLLFVSLELISIPSYMLLFIGRPGRDADEATAKYFYLSILSSAILLYGFATLYGLAGTTQFESMQASLSVVREGPFAAFVPLAVVMILCGFCFKIAAVPFQFYAPDVYQATTSLNAALLAIVPKIAGIVGLVRILVISLPHDGVFAWQMVVVLSLATMTLANVAALWQTHIRRLMAYSSIAHAGYLMIGLASALAADTQAAWGASAVAAMLYYVLAYGAATMGVFASLGYLSDDDQTFSSLPELAGIGRYHPVIGGLMAICLFSLSGIPPLAGFFGKFALFRSALAAGLSGTQPMNLWFLVLAVAGVLNAAIAAAYYLRVIATMYFESPSTDEPSRVVVMGNHGAGLAALISSVLVVLIGVSAGPLMSSAQSSAAQIWPPKADVAALSSAPPAQVVATPRLRSQSIVIVSSPTP